MKSYIRIGEFQIGIRLWDKHLWKKYILPTAYCGKTYKHHYYQYYYRWLIFYWCKTRKCELCGKYMTSAGGNNIWNCEGDKVLITICKACYDKDKHGWIRAATHNKGDLQCITCKRAHSGSCECRFPDGKECAGYLKIE